MFVKKTVSYANRPLNGTNKDFSPTKEKNNIIDKLSGQCGSYYVEQTSQKFHLRVDQHVLKNKIKLLNDLSVT